jgi:hypothetical protein
MRRIRMDWGSKGEEQQRKILMTEVTLVRCLR